MNGKNGKIRCKKCDDIIESKYRHDFKSCKCGKISIDGGSSYLKCSWPEGDPTEWIEILQTPNIEEDNN